MNAINPISTAPAALRMQAAAPAAADMPRVADSAGTDMEKVREVFDQFVGETFYSQMLSSMRKSLGKPAYFHGGRAEEVFQGQLDQILSERMTQNSASDFTGSMFELYQLSSLQRP